MTLNAFFQVSVSVFCIVSTIYLIFLLIWTILLRSQINKLIVKIEEISEIAKNTAGDAEAFVERTIDSLETFKKTVFTFDFIGRIVTELIGLIKHNTKQIK